MESSVLHKNKNLGKLIKSKLQNLGKTQKNAKHVRNFLSRKKMEKINQINGKFNEILVYFIYVDV